MNLTNWALILGGSSGIGLACARELAKKKYNLIIVHRDGKIGSRTLEEHILKWKNGFNIEILRVNTNINTDEGKEELKNTLLKIPQKSLRIFIHSVADGHIKPFFDSENALSEEDLLYTINSMGVSFATWTQWLFKNNLFSNHAKVFGFTSDGCRKVIKHYGAVGAAKAVLETLCRYMAVELASHGISVNLLCPGVVNTKAIRVFPDAANFIEQVTQKNPQHKLTTPEEVAQLLVALAEINSNWLTGEMIHIDGGEQHVF